MGLSWRSLLILDVESRGLQGEGYAFGAVLVVEGEIVEKRLEWCRPEAAAGNQEGWNWANEHVTPLLQAATAGPTVSTPAQVRGRFWALWRSAADEHDAQLVADVAWPVEARFLARCVDDDPDGRWWSGPFPLLDVATLRAAGLAEETKDIHDPLIDAGNSWLSMRTWWLGQTAGENAGR